jgi:hypothetical protein
MIQSKTLKLIVATTMLSSCVGLAHAAMTKEECHAASEKMMKGDTTIDAAAYSTDCAQYEMDEATKAAAKPATAAPAPADAMTVPVTK